MDALTKIIVAASVAVATFLLGIVIFRLKKRIETNIILQRKKRSVSMVSELLKVNCPSSSLLIGAVFPSANGKIKPDAVIVNHGGVLVISVADLRGSIDNPFQGDWRMFYKEKAVLWRNPLAINSARAKAISAIFNSEEITNVPVKFAIVYIDPKVKFKIKMKDLVLVDRLPGNIRDMNKENVLNGSEIKSCVNALKKYRIK